MQGDIAILLAALLGATGVMNWATVEKSLMVPFEWMAATSTSY